MGSVKERGSWASKAEFILSCLGYAIGIGNVWRFPYLCYRNGGGAFLIPYLTMLALCGIPLFFLEVCLGQFSGRGCITVFKIAPLLKGAGLAIVVINFICTSYYNVIIAYPILFLWKSFRSQLPWMDCHNEWNTDRCLELVGPERVQILMNNSMLSPTERWRTPADEFFHNEILHISEGIDSPGGIVWPLFVCNLIAWMVIYACIINGVKSVGKVVYFTATFPFVVLAILFLRGITLPGAMEGIRFYIVPQWSQLTSLKVWADAAIQIFFSLGPGWGGIVNMASYNKFKNNTKLDSILIPIVNCGTSIFAGFVVFSVLGYLSHKTGLPVSTVATGGPGLAFVTYPEAIAMLPLPQLWASLFFLMLFFLGIDSMFVQIEAIISSILDEIPWLRKWQQLITAGVCFVMFLLSTSCTTEMVIREIYTRETYQVNSQYLELILSYIMAQEKLRGSWASKTEFILSCLGYAIGIGNVWRFPYLCYRNGGGAFLIPYLIMLAFCGIPLFFLEVCLGQFSGRGCVTVFKIAPLLKGAGLAIVMINVICVSYYNVIMAYSILYLWQSLRSQLPWMHCHNVWSTDSCIELDEPDKVQKLMNRSMFSHLERWRTPADEYFHYEILHISDGIESLGKVVWPLFVCNVIAWMVIYACIINGVKSVGKVVYFTATFPFVVLSILFLRGMTLPGAMEGIRFYIVPQWSQLTSLKVWADAAIQIFFSLGPGWGGIVNMASYNKFKNNTKNDSILIPIVNSGTSIFAGFVVFSVLGHLSHQTGLPISTVATGGPGLAFITYPEAIAMLPFPQLWAALFFMMLFFLGVDTIFVQIEAIISAILDEVQWLRKWQRSITTGLCFVMFLLSIACTTEGGMYLLQLFDWYSASISVILVCIVEVVAVAWIYGVRNFVRDVEFMIDRTVDRFWILSWKFITPCILSFLFVTTILYNTEVTYNGVRYPKWAIAIGWMSCISSMLCIPGYALYKIASSKGSLSERLKSNLRPSDWGPADELQRSLWQSHVEMYATK